MISGSAGAALLSRARFIAWPLAMASLALVAMRYETLPATLPLTRWSSAPKSWLTALRVPMICLVSLGLVEVLCGSIRRAPNFDRGHALTAVLLLTASWKAAAAAASLLLLPWHFVWLDTLWIGGTTVGIALALWMGKDLMRGGRLRRLSWSRTEAWFGTALVLWVIVLEFPLLHAHR